MSLCCDVLCGDVTGSCRHLYNAGLSPASSTRFTSIVQECCRQAQVTRIEMRILFSSDRSHRWYPLLGMIWSTRLGSTHVQAAMHTDIHTYLPACQPNGVCSVRTPKIVFFACSLSAQPSLCPQRVTDMGDVGRIKLAYGSAVEEELAAGPLEGPSTVSLLAVEEVEGEEGGVDVVEDCESVRSDGEEGVEEEVVYPAGGKTVDEDAVLFHVTTPVKVTMPEAPLENSEVSGSHTHIHTYTYLPTC